MKKYDFNIDYLIKTRDYLIEKSEIYNSTLETYQGLINNYDKRINPECKDFSDTSEEVSIENFLNDILPETNVNAVNLLLPAKDVIINYHNNIEERELTKLHWNNEQLVDYTINLINQIPNKSFVHIIKSFVKSKNNLLLIKHKNKLPMDFYGLTFIDFVKQQPYGIISRDNTVQDIITLTHELFHMVINKGKNPLYMTPQNDIYTEVEGYLANLIVCDLMKKDLISDEESKTINYLDLFRTAYSIYDTFITTSILNHLNADYTVNLKDLKLYLKRENIKTPVTKKNHQGFFHDKYNSDINDAFSYLVALDLYDMYKTDPEKAINHLFTIAKFDGENVEEELESIDVTFHQDGYQNLDKQCQILLKRKTTRTK